MTPTSNPTDDTYVWHTLPSGIVVQLRNDYGIVHARVAVSLGSAQVLPRVTRADVVALLALFDADGPPVAG